MISLVVLGADLGEDGELAGERGSARACSACGIAIVPSEISTWRMPSSRSHATSPSTRPSRSAISVSVPPSTTGTLVRAVARELRLEVGGDQRRAPAELDEVDARPATSIRPVDLGDRQALVEHVGEAPLARLGAALGEVEEAGQRRATATGRRRP